METWRQEWANVKREIALRLSNGECGGAYGEAVIILCAAISALSADVWPGRGIDRVRFVEALIRFTPAEFNVSRISIPLLISKLRQVGETQKSEKLKKEFLDMNLSLVVIGDEVDRDEAEVLRICSNLSLKEIREQSYANILYGEIRSGYAHEYRPGERADSSPMTSVDTSISYINWAHKRDRNIHFHIKWLSQIASSIAVAVDTQDEHLPYQNPAKWWVHG